MFDVGIERFGRLYVASSHVSRAVARSRSRNELIEEVVRVLVEAGDFAMAVIHWHNPETNELLPVAQFGDDVGYSNQIRIFTDGRAEAQGPGGTSFTRGVPYICEDFLNDPRTLPWRPAALASGWRASAAFPIATHGVTRGLLSVYEREIGLFGPDQIELLQQVALDLAFGLEHLEVEEARTVTEQRLKFVLEAAALGTFDWDLATDRVIWDKRSERLFGLEPGTFEGTRDAFEKRVDPADLPKLHRALNEARDAHDHLSVEFRVRWPDGSEHWICGEGRFQYDDLGRPRKLYGAALDISERKRSEAALLESEARLQQAVRVANIGIFERNLLTGAAYWSPPENAREAWRSHHPIASVQQFLELVHSEDRVRITAAVERAHDPTGDGLLDTAYRMILPDGSLRWVKTRSQTFFAGEGSTRYPAQTIGAIRDITEQKESEEEQTKLTAVVAKSRDFIGIGSLEGRVIYLNQAAMNLVGIPTIEEARQKSIFDFFAPADLEQARDDMYQAVIGAGYWYAASRVRHFQTGALIDVEITGFLIRDDKGAPLYIATVTRDITERKHAEAEKAKLEEQLFQAQKMESIGRLAGGVAHDFNNLLTVINGHSQLLLTKLAENDPDRFPVAQIFKAGESAAALTRQLLAFSRKQLLQPRVVDLNRVIREMQPLLERLVGDDVNVRVELDSENSNVFADPHQVEQMILNLAANARDAMPHGGRLLIETAPLVLSESHNLPQLSADLRPGLYVALSVTDSGVGMDEQTQERIFEPFFTTKPVGRGTGLGLSTVQGTVAQTGGYIDVLSKPGQGTTFKIYLPGHAGPDAEMEKPIEPALAGNETILVVEDLPQVRDFAASALKSYGYRVLQAEGAQQALLSFQREQIHLVLTDVVMPLSTGPELALALLELHPTVPVLFMSGHAGTLNDTVIESGHYIPKPFSPDQLARKVRAILDQPATARILIADDEPGVRGFLRAALEQGGYEVIEVANGKQALRAMREKKPVDLAIIDLIMPEQEGLETIQTIRKELPGVPIIAISGAYGGRYLKTAQLLGAKAVLDKPVSPDSLLAAVAEILKKPVS